MVENLSKDLERQWANIPIRKPIAEITAMPKATQPQEIDIQSQQVIPQPIPVQEISQIAQQVTPTIASNPPNLTQTIKIMGGGINERNLDKWGLKLELNNYSQNTAKLYLMFAKKFEELCNGQKPNQDLIDSFIAQHNHGLARAFLKGYLKFLKRKDLEVPESKGRKSVKVLEILSKEQIEALISAAKTRESLMIKMLFETGLRISELLDIKVGAINFEKKEIKILGKGNKERIVFLSNQTIEDLKNYFHSLNLNTHENLFNITPQRFWQILKELGKKVLGIDVKLHAHMFRHSFASYLERQGYAIQEIQKLLGHADISTTAIYVHLNEDLLRQKWEE